MKQSVGAEVVNHGLPMADELVSVVDKSVQVGMLKMHRAVLECIAEVGIKSFEELPVVLKIMEAMQEVLDGNE